MKDSLAVVAEEPSEKFALVDDDRFTKRCFIKI